MLLVGDHYFCLAVTREGARGLCIWSVTEKNSSRSAFFTSRAFGLYCGGFGNVEWKPSMMDYSSQLPAAVLRLREQVLKANLEIVKHGLVLFSFGNASGIDRDSGLVVIKPSGVDYVSLTPEQMVVCDLEGTVAPGSLRPSSDLDTHLHLYRTFTGIGGIVHTHSTVATSWAQAGMEIPPFGTTHADYFYGPVPVTEELCDAEIARDYVLNTGRAITRRFAGIDPLAVPAVLVRGHAPFCWGVSAHDAAHNAIVLESVATMARNTLILNPGAQPVSQALLDRHYFRKHGSKATYGQQL
jgi:L-ribulose-5-phosphate 4-epimerase